jgi:hypothetical protein
MTPATMTPDQLRAAEWSAHNQPGASTPRVCGDSGGKKSDGTPCGMNVPDGVDLCPHHNPNMKDVMAARRAKGNASRSRLAMTAKAAALRGCPAVPQNLEDAVSYAAWAVHQVASGQMDSRTGHEIAFILNTLKAGLEKRDLLREVQQLRRDLAAARKAA